MGYIEAQDKKLKFEIKTNMLQAGWFDWYSINARDFRLIENRILAKSAKPKKAITYSFEAQIASCFFQYLKDIIS